MNDSERSEPNDAPKAQLTHAKRANDTISKPLFWSSLRKVRENVYLKTSHKSDFFKKFRVSSLDFLKQIYLLYYEPVFPVTIQQGGHFLKDEVIAALSNE